MSNRLFSPGERALGVKIADYISARITDGNEFMDVLLEIDERWPDVRYDVVTSALVLHLLRVTTGQDWQ